MYSLISRLIFKIVEPRINKAVEEFFKYQFALPFLRGTDLRLQKKQLLGLLEQHIKSDK